MAGLDNGIVSAALTTIYNSFGVTPTWGAWMITLYTLGIAVSVPIIGKLSDNYGRKRLFMMEIILFGLGSFLVAISPNFTILLVARLIQAIGGGGIFIIASSHVLATLPKHQQGKALGLLGGMHGLSAVIGPNAGALILHLTGSWEWMFYINIPISLFLLVFGGLKLKESTAPSGKALDVTGAMYLTMSVLALMIGITNVKSGDLLTNLLNVGVLPFLAIGILGIFLFLQHEKQLEKAGADPVISYALLKKRGFRLTLILSLLSGGFLSTIIFIPAYVQQVLQIPAENAGFWLTPLAVASGIGAGLGGVLTDRIGAKRTVTISGMIGLVGFYLFYAYVDGGGMFIIASILAGIGLGFLLGAPLNVLIVAEAREDQYGTSLGTLSLIRQIGLTLFPTIFASFVTTGVIQIEPTIKQTFSSNVIQFAGDGGGSYEFIMSQIAKVNDPYIQMQLFDLVAGVMRIGFDKMFFLGLIIAITIMIISLHPKVPNNTNKNE
jgi:EmrB/QacA subfamily drug resistance transporter